MKPMQLVICGWGPFREETEIDFSAFENRGLFLITGPTGAGKTTVFDAVTYALYGTLSGTMREKGSVRSDFADAGTPTFVRLVMQHGGVVYTVMRNPEYLRPKKRKSGRESGESPAFTKEKENAVLYLPDGSAVEGTTEVNRRLKEILGLDERQFKQISMIAQGEFARMLSASGAEKTRIFREIFGTGIYSRLAEKLKEEAGGLYKQVMEYRHRMEEDVRLFTAGDAEWEMLTADGDYHYDSICAYLKRRVDGWKGEEQALREKGAALEESLLALNSAHSEAKNVNTRLAQLEEAKKRLAACEKREEGLAALKQEKELAEAAEHVSPWKERLEQAGRQLAESRERSAALELELNDLEKERKELLPLYEKREEIQAAFSLEESIKESRRLCGEAESALTGRKKELERLQKQFEKQDAETKKRRQRYEEADSRYKRAVVGIAARMVREGAPCPVCGSLSHPHVAEISESIPGEEELTEWKEQYEQADQERQRLFAEARTARAGAEEAEKTFLQRQEELDRVWEKRNDLSEDIRGVVREPLLQEKKRFEEKLERFTRLQAMTEEKRQAIENWKQMEKKHREEQERLLEEWQQALSGYGFSDEADYESHIRDKKRRQEIEAVLLEHAKEKRGAEELCAHLEQETAGRTCTVLSALEKQMEELREEKTEQNRKLQTVCARKEEAQRILKSLLDYRKRIGPLEEQYGLLGDLDNLANGKNPKRLVFEQYVLTGYFEEILKAANLRLLRMSEGRFALKRATEVSDGRTKDSMEMLVMDYYTGKSRSVRTLSGGESFKASLALALGMSDVIQAESGGIRVEALFVDEGFGALDAESLDQACAVLAGLGGKDRMVGIISHVAELRERIEAQIIVEKTNHGSYVRQKD